ncbi:MAG: very short patch repair endonuclease [Jatrophihabitantaceae bacterium]
MRDPAITSKIMAAVKSKDTKPELLLRRELHARGVRYRLHTNLPGRPDIVFPKAKLCVFVDGDFWHGHGWRERGFESWQAQFANHANPEKWVRKIGRNIDRDSEVNEALVSSGWRVLRVLESALLREVSSVADQVEALVRPYY